MDRQKYLENTGGIGRMQVEELLDENERLEKEKEWLLSRCVEDSCKYIYYPHMEMEEIRSSVEAEMQQALKEE